MARTSRFAGRFEIHGQAGVGGMATVYRATDTLSGDPIALKVMHGADDAARARFAREAELLVELRHPALPRYVAHGAEDDVRWLAMEWLDGQTLAQRLAQGPLPAGETVALGSRLADALGAIHRAGAVHRDVTPDNVMLGAGDPRAVTLIDLGIARRPTDLKVTRQGAAVGTYPYMSPEQARGRRGEPDEVDARSDVFSLGCVLYECLTGVAPFRGKSPRELRANILLADPQPPRALDAGVPAPLEVLILRMLAKDREHRPADGAAVTAELSALAPPPPASTTHETGDVTIDARAAVERVAGPVKANGGGRPPARRAGSNITRSVDADAAEGAVRVRLLRLLPIGRAAAVTLALDDDPVTIGREGRLRLQDPAASRLHAVIAFDAEAGCYVVTDQGSKNGTYANGVAIQEAPLTDGTVLRIGHSLVLFVEAELASDDTLTAPSSRLVGQSLAIMRVRAEVALVARHLMPVLIVGETGTGKEVAAEEIHRLSRRAGEFVPVNCAAIPASLAESELFGHALGAYTGAAQARVGLFATADGGTLFLDEIGELSGEVQAKLLRALAKGEIRPIGVSVARHVNVRVIAATHRDLVQATRLEGGETFRSDLYARLAGFTIQVPPLRARRDDIAPLAQSILAVEGKPLPLTTDAAEALLLYDWPYNVRELEQVLAAARVRAGARPISIEHLPPEIGARVRARQAAVVPARGDPPTTPPSEPEPSRDVAPTREELCEALRRFEGNVAKVAEHFRKERPQIYRWAKRYGVDMDSFRG